MLSQVAYKGQQVSTRGKNSTVKISLAALPGSLATCKLTECKPGSATPQNPPSRQLSSQQEQTFPHLLHLCAPESTRKSKQVGEATAEPSIIFLSLPTLGHPISSQLFLLSHWECLVLAPNCYPHETLMPNIIPKSSLQTLPWTGPTHHSKAIPTAYFYNPKLFTVGAAGSIACCYIDPTLPP